MCVIWKDLHIGLPYVAAEVGGIAHVLPVELRDSPSNLERARHRAFFRESNERRWIVAVPSESPRTYNAMERAAEVLTAATAVNVRDAAQVVGFVGKWGFLSESLDTSPDCYPLDFACLALEQLQENTRRMTAMQAKRWRSSDLPPRPQVLMESRVSTLKWLQGQCGFPVVDYMWSKRPDDSLVIVDQRRSFVFEKRPDQEKRAVRLAPRIPSKFWPRLYWSHFALKLNPEIIGVHPVLEIDPKTGHPIQQFRGFSLSNVLYLELWQRAGDPDLVGRLCAGCKGVFFRSPNNARRIYCSSRCKIRVNVRKHRARRPATTSRTSTSRPSYAKSTTSAMRMSIVSRPW